MTETVAKTYFFCGVGGSGMSALALILLQKGCCVLGSDRAFDQGHSPDKFRALEAAGITMTPQDGSGLSDDVDALIVSSAIEDSIPDVKAAKDLGLPIIKRAELLAGLFNETPTSISIAGTSGKSTVTGMLATVLEHAQLDPTVMNGGLIRNFDSNMRVGAGDLFLTETDESDGSIALFNPSIAVLNNVALDHKSPEELDQLFGDFIARASRAVILNFDDAKTKALAAKAQVPVISYGIESSADLVAMDIQQDQHSISFTTELNCVKLNVPGIHNVSNALACLAVCQVLDIDFKQAIAGLEKFTGIGRRFEVMGTKNDITVIDDFAHNPDKIAATLKTLKAFDGRLIIMFQPHGFGPLKLMGKEIAETFAQFLDKDDLLFMPEPYYAGGTADRSVGSKGIVEMIGPRAQAFETRAEILPEIIAQAQSGDRIIIMGARDDTLSDFAYAILDGL